MASNKEFVQKSIQNLKNHLKENHSNLSNLKIFENVGDHPYVIKFTPFNEYDVNLTLQINNNFNLNNSSVVLSQVKQKRHSEKVLNSFEELLNNKVKELDGKNDKFLVKLFEKSFDYVQKNFEKYQTEEQKISKKKESKTNKNKLDDEETNTKKISMKTACDVVNRIQWDEEINKEFITVGYMDRFLGLKECAFNTFDWGDIVLADYGALAIPEHRISYFKYKNEIIWDKASRLDNIFGSTGSGLTIRDVIKRLEETNFDPKVEETEPVHRVEREKFKNESPNYFISVPINSYQIKSNFDELNSDLLEINEEVESFLVPDTSMHITLCTLRIDSKEEMDNVKKVLNDLEIKQNEPIKLKFKGLGEFYRKVLYAKCDNVDMLRDLKNLIFNKMNEMNINTAGNYYEFVPHLTVFKIKSNTNNTEMSVDDFVDKSIWEKYKDFNFGEENVQEIQLCKMVNVFVNKVYPIEHSIKI